jgi:hypothetical protein
MPDSSKPYKYLECCINSTAKDIHAMIDAASDVTITTVRRNCDIADFEKQLGYDTGAERGGLRLKDDWHVGYYKSIYKGQPCYYIKHSAIEYIFVKERNERTQGSGPRDRTKSFEVRPRQ